MNPCSLTWRRKMIKTLLKIRLRSATAGIGKLVSGKKKKTVSPLGIAVLVLLVALILASIEMIFVGIAVLLAPTLIAIGADWFYFFIFTGIDVSLVFILGVFITRSEIFECRDNELLLSMPIRPRDIVAARLLTLVLWNYAESFLFFLPAVIVYGVMGGSYLGIIGSSVVFLFLPLIPTSLSCLVGYAVSLISAKFKNKTFITVIFFFAFFGAYMVGYSSLVNGIEDMLLAAQGAASTVGRLSFLKAIGEASMLKPLPLALLCIASVLSFIVTATAISTGFSRIVFVSRGGKKTVYREKKRVRRSPLFALTKKELARFFTSSSYIINDSLGLVFALVAAIFVLVKRDMLFQVSSAFAALIGTESVFLTVILLTTALGFCSGMSFISSCALSLEGKNFPLLKSMPLSGREVLLSKTLSHIIMTAPFVLVSSVIMCIATGEYSFIWYFILVPQLVNASCALIGIILNTVFPRFDYKNDVEVIKQSLSVFLTMISVVLLTLGIAALGIWLSTLIYSWLSALLMLALAIAVFVALLTVLLTVSVKKYERL